MTRTPGLVLLVFISCYLVSVPVWAQNQTGAESQRSQEVRPQPGATQAGPTSDLDPAPKFNPDYFVGEWTFEGALAESPHGEGGPRTGTEIVRKAWDGRLWEIAITGEGPDGAPFTGEGIFLFEDSFFAGQSFMRYEFTQGMPLLRAGTVGCDSGGVCIGHFESPPVERNGATVQLRGQFYVAGLFSYRLTTEISVDKGDFKNLGTIWYMRDQDSPSAPVSR